MTKVEAIIAIIGEANNIMSFTSSRFKKFESACNSLGINPDDLREELDLGEVKK